MNILLVATEVAPLLVHSELGSVVSALGRSLRLLGHEVTILCPRHPDFSERGALLARRLSPLALSHGREGLVFEASLPSGVKLVLLETEESGAHPTSTISSELELKQAISFADAVYHFVQERAESGSGFELVHALGVRAGLCLSVLSSMEAEVARLFTWMGMSDSPAVRIDSDALLALSNDARSAFKEAPDLSSLVCAAAQEVVVFSEAQSQELAQLGKLGKAPRSLEERPPLSISGGVDEAVYNPAVDAALPLRFDAADPSGKARGKAKVLAELELHVGVDSPFLVVESALEAEMTGWVRLLPQLVRQGAAIAFLAPRQATPAEAEVLRSLEGDVTVLSPRQSAADPSQRFEPGTYRRLLGAADFWILPEAGGPLAEGLLRAARYGAIPVAPAVGGARDVLTDADSELKSGTGFGVDPVELERDPVATWVSLVGRLAVAFRHPGFERFRRRIMRQELSWDRPARRYAQLYRKLAVALARAS